MPKADPPRAEKLGNDILEFFNGLNQSIDEYPFL